MPDHLHHLEQHSIHLIREAFARLKPLAMLWSLGKDSNTLLWMVRKAFLGRVPFPVILLDTGNEFAEVYAFRDRYVREWNLDYINAPCPPIEATDPALPPKARAAARKTLGLEGTDRRSAASPASCSASAATSSRFAPRSAA